MRMFDQLKFDDISESKISGPIVNGTGFFQYKNDVQNYEFDNDLTFHYQNRISSENGQIQFNSVFNEFDKVTFYNSNPNNLVSIKVSLIPKAENPNQFLNFSSLGIGCKDSPMLEWGKGLPNVNVFLTGSDDYRITGGSFLLDNIYSNQCLRKRTLSQHIHTLGHYNKGGFDGNSKFNVLHNPSSLHMIFERSAQDFYFIVGSVDQEDQLFITAFDENGVQYNIYNNWKNPTYGSLKESDIFNQIRYQSRGDHMYLSSIISDHSNNFLLFAVKRNTSKIIVEYATTNSGGSVFYSLFGIVNYGLVDESKCEPSTLHRLTIDYNNSVNGSPNCPCLSNTIGTDQRVPTFTFEYKPGSCEAHLVARVYLVDQMNQGSGVVSTWRIEIINYSPFPISNIVFSLNLEPKEKWEMRSYNGDFILPQWRLNNPIHTGEFHSAGIRIDSAESLKVIILDSDCQPKVIIPSPPLIELETLPPNPYPRTFTPYSQSSSSESIPPNPPGFSPQVSTTIYDISSNNVGTPFHYNSQQLNTGFDFTGVGAENTYSFSSFSGIFSPETTYDLSGSTIGEIPSFTPIQSGPPNIQPPYSSEEEHTLSTPSLPISTAIYTTSKSTTSTPPIDISRTDSFNPHGEVVFPTSTIGSTTSTSTLSSSSSSTITEVQSTPKPTTISTSTTMNSGIPTPTPSRTSTSSTTSGVQTTPTPTPHHHRRTTNSFEFIAEPPESTTSTTSTTTISGRPSTISTITTTNSVPTPSLPSASTTSDQHGQSINPPSITMSTTLSTTNSVPTPSPPLASTTSDQHGQSINSPSTTTISGRPSTISTITTTNSAPTPSPPLASTTSDQHGQSINPPSTTMSTTLSTTNSVPKPSPPLASTTSDQHGQSINPPSTTMSTTLSTTNSVPTPSPPLASTTSDQHGQSINPPSTTMSTTLSTTNSVPKPSPPLASTTSDQHGQSINPPSTMSTTTTTTSEPTPSPPSATSTTTTNSAPTPSPPLASTTSDQHGQSINPPSTTTTLSTTNSAPTPSPPSTTMSTTLSTTNSAPTPSPPSTMSTTTTNLAPTPSPPLASTTSDQHGQSINPPSTMSTTTTATSEPTPSPPSTMSTTTTNSAPTPSPPLASTTSDQHGQSINPPSTTTTLSTTNSAPTPSPPSATMSTTLSTTNSEPTPSPPSTMSTTTTTNSGLTPSPPLASTMSDQHGQSINPPPTTTLSTTNSAPTPSPPSTTTTNSVSTPSPPLASTTSDQHGESINPPSTSSRGSTPDSQSDSSDFSIDLPIDITSTASTTSTIGSPITSSTSISITSSSSSSIPATSSSTTTSTTSTGTIPVTSSSSTIGTTEPSTSSISTTSLSTGSIPAISSSTGGAPTTSTTTSTGTIPATSSSSTIGTTEPSTSSMSTTTSSTSSIPTTSSLTTGSAPTTSTSSSSSTLNTSSSTIGTVPTTSTLTPTNIGTTSSTTLEIDTRSNIFCRPPCAPSPSLPITPDNCICPTNTEGNQHPPRNSPQNTNPTIAPSTTTTSTMPISTTSTIEGQTTPTPTPSSNGTQTNIYPRPVPTKPPYIPPHLVPGTPRSILFDGDGDVTPAGRIELMKPDPQGLPSSNSPLLVDHAQVYQYFRETSKVHPIEGVKAFLFVPMFYDVKYAAVSDKNGTVHFKDSDLNMNQKIGVEFEIPKGMMITRDHPPFTTTLPYEVQFENISAGANDNMFIMGMVWNDTSGDGHFTVGRDHPLSNITMRLYVDDNAVAEAVTKENGIYIFDISRPFTNGYIEVDHQYQDVFTTAPVRHSIIEDLPSSQSILRASKSFTYFSTGGFDDDFKVRSPTFDAPHNFWGPNFALTSKRVPPRVVKRKDIANINNKN
ncbi:hypothetical protein PPL_00486 [Heterostelium album PN500]|uniref:Uncharacterized protein n=1 Tax=Heterostelium pallidum (strain ATCC 26659 / Pp 5 / PN500) TaxID=670386 RepID=D3AWL1_HETP5|nr:hypothetical protein PPL_00486 [Heterostelium album PN500]EFA86684.1 hypothetical protein PPL_00486 [Heterostelium album PN500]|eukprot:XP_020438788.1 hypothetical protein PPL_00486 [Heterostelium album PN500]